MSCGHCKIWQCAIMCSCVRDEQMCTDQHRKHATWHHVGQSEQVAGRTVVAVPTAASVRGLAGCSAAAARASASRSREVGLLAAARARRCCVRRSMGPGCTVGSPRSGGAAWGGSW